MLAGTQLVGGTLATLRTALGFARMRTFGAA